MERTRPRSSPDLRCAVCHDALLVAPQVCPDCATLTHPECGEELGRCPTLGCGRLVVDDAAWLEARDGWVARWGIGLGVLVGAVVGLGFPYEEALRSSVEWQRVLGVVRGAMVGSILGAPVLFALRAWWE